LNDLQNNDYYLYVSSSARTTAVDSLFSKNDFLEKTIFGKKIDSDLNFFYLIRNYPWQASVVFDQYDDTVDLAEKRYYAVVYPENNDIGDYRVYKCLFNNYGSASRFPPNFNESQEDQIYPMGDGYIWKFMYSITVADFENYNTLGYIPITADTLVANVDFTVSTVEEILVENRSDNKGYEKIEGFVADITTVDNGGTEVFDTIVIEPNSGFTLSPVSGYYSGQTFYVKDPDDNGEVHTIDTYTYNTVTGQGTIRLLGTVPYANSAIFEGTTRYDIFPRIEITGDGTGAIAIPNVIDGAIDSITMIDRGTGYTRAAARVIDPEVNFDPLDANTLDVRATLRPILSPRGGHGSNLVDELRCKHCLLFTEMTENDNNTVPITNQFAKIGIVKNPQFTSANNDIFDNRISVELESVEPLSVNDFVTQVDTNNETIFSALVHEISANTVYLSEYFGPYLDQANTNFSLDPELPIRSPQGDLLEINTTVGGDPIITYPIYVPKTGEVYYMNDFFPVERNEDSRELFKIVIEF
jgi:hypothetical protein